MTGLQFYRMARKSQFTILSYCLRFPSFIVFLKEARRAAQKGMDVERVDDKVKKAVALTNQAANAARVAAVKAVHR